MKVCIKKNYAEARKADYPSIEEQLDLIYHDASLELWRKRIQYTKDRFPKRE